MTIEPVAVASAISTLIGIGVGGLTVRKLGRDVIDGHIDERASRQVAEQLDPIVMQVNKLTRVVTNGLSEKMDTTIKTVQEMAAEQRHHGEKLARVEGQLAILVDER